MVGILFRGLPWRKLLFFTEKIGISDINRLQFFGADLLRIMQCFDLSTCLGLEGLFFSDFMDNFRIFNPVPKLEKIGNSGFRNNVNPFFS